MTDITVQEIVATFKNIKREALNSTAQTDEFLELMKAKSEWTLEEYRELFFEYALQNMNIKFRDFIAIKSIENKYDFHLDWSDYFKVLDNIKGVRKLKKYVNYYLWYRSVDMNEDIYKEFMKKPYFKLLTSDSKSRFLSHFVKKDNTNAWVINYFTSEEIKNGLKQSTFNILICASSVSVAIQEVEQAKAQEFYNLYEDFMDYKTKVKFFHEAVRTGVIPLIQYLYQEKGINKLNEVKLLWYVCSDISSKNTIEILQCLKDMGVRLTTGVLKKSQAHGQWGYMEHTEKLNSFIMDPLREKNYLKLDKKIGNKPERTIVRKL